MSDVDEILLFSNVLVILEPFQSGDPNNDYLSSVINQPLTDALYEMTKVKPDDPLEWLAHFMLEHNKNRPLIHGESHQLLQRMQTIEIKNTEQNISKQNPKQDQGLQKCGCYLSRSESVASSSNSSCCSKIH